MRKYFRCPWCGKDRTKWSEWEQKALHSEDYKPMCSYCARRRLDNPWNALLPMRRVDGK